MVYESDFYTTRRPYSRPLVSSYSVTSPVVLPLSTLIQLRGGIHHMPYVAHKRLVPVIHTPVHTFYYSGSVIPVRIHSRVRPSILAAEINRIRDLWRPSSISYVERFLNSRDNIYFDDEAREIRARVDSLLRRVHVYIPRASPSDFAEEIIPERMRSDDYIRRLLSGRNNEKKDMEHVSWYEVPERGNFGNLACVKYVAGKPHSIRRPYYKVADLRPSDIKNDVNLLSYYSKNRQAAANASPDEPKTDRELRKARALETEWSEAIAKREAQKAQKAAEEAAKATAEEEEEETKEKGQRIVEGKVIEKAAQVEEPAKEAAKEAEEPAKEVEQSPKEAEAPSEEAAPAAEPVKKTKAKKDIKKRAVEPLQKEQQPTPEPVKQKEPTPEPVQQKEPTPEPVQQKEPTPEPVQPKEPTPEPVEKEEPAPEAASEAAPEPAQQEEPSVEAAQEQEAPAAEQTARETAEEAEPPTQGEVAEPQESKAEESESAEPVSEEKEQNEEEQSDSVRQQKKEAIKRAEEYLAKIEEESKTQEERRQAAEDERVRLEIEEQKTWEALQIAQERKAHLDEIIEQEKAEEARKTEEKKIEAERAEIERIEAAERLLNAQKLALLLEQQERMIIEERTEDVPKLEKEEKTAEVALNGIGESKEYDCSCDDQLTGEITDQEKEEKPYDLVMEDDTRIEEENAVDDEVDDIPADPFVEEPQGAEECRLPQGGAASNDEPKIEEVTSGGEESFEWGDEDA